MAISSQKMGCWYYGNSSSNADAGNIRSNALVVSALEDDDLVHRFKNIRQSQTSYCTEFFLSLMFFLMIPFYVIACIIMVIPFSGMILCTMPWSSPKCHNLALVSIQDLRDISDWMGVVSNDTSFNVDSDICCWCYMTCCCVCQPQPALLPPEIRGIFLKKISREVY